ncbi:MAG TPA: GNAT family N-acetyltransferase, partial [Actinotalea sp.]|nr:GNAT family N-acetyltransferase [Actinotalea sp.]
MDTATWQTNPLTPDRFDDFADIVNPNRRQVACWCLSHRLRAADIRELGGDGDDQRERAMRALCERSVP